MDLKMLLGITRMKCGKNTHIFLNNFENFVLYGYMMH
jgi:hypothetical protein